MLTFRRSAPVASRFPVRLVFSIAALFACVVALLPVRAAETQSAAASPDLKTLRFAVYGDTRDGHAMHRRIVAGLIAVKPAFVLQTGDLVHTGSNAGLWRIYDDITAPLKAHIPLYPARGNHDLGGPLYEAHVPDEVAKPTKLYYSFDRENCHFVALAVDEVTKYGPSSPQYQWLIKDLEAAHKRAQWTFVFFHVPPYSIGAHGSDLDVRKTLCPVFEKYGVRVVFNGHDHNYYHTIRNGVHYIVTGGGGAPLYGVDPGKGAIQGDRYESVNHFLVVDITGTLAAFAAYRADGSLLDRFSLHTE